MNPQLNARIIPTLYADLPASFEERVNGQMAYELQGDQIYVMRDWVWQAVRDFPDFEVNLVYVELAALFEAFPDMQDATLSSR